MLSLESRGKSYTKTDHNRRLRTKLNDRSSSAVEFKHANISAVLDRMGLPYISGYKPRGNVQALLHEVVGARLQPLLKQLRADLATPQQQVVLNDVLGILVPRPDRALVVHDEARDSYDDTGRDRFVEVKTTRYGRRTPFYISANELRFSRAKAPAYHLYRVFDYREHPKLFTLPGDVARHVRLNPVSYRARF